MNATTIMRRWLKLAEDSPLPEDQIINPKWGTPLEFEAEAPGSTDDPSETLKELDSFRKEIAKLTLADVVLRFTHFVDYMQGMAFNFQETIKEYDKKIEKYENTPNYALDYHHRVVVMKLDTPEEWFEAFKQQVENE